MTLIEFIGPKEVAAADEDRFVGYLAGELRISAAQVYVSHYVPAFWQSAWKCFKGKLPFRVEAE
jgi:hypothetical protein